MIRQLARTTKAALPVALQLAQTIVRQIDPDQGNSVTCLASVITASGVDALELRRDVRAATIVALAHPLPGGVEINANPSLVAD